MIRERAALGLYCTFVVENLPPLDCIAHCVRRGMAEENATATSKFFENKFIQEFKKFAEPELKKSPFFSSLMRKGKLSREQVAVALIAYIDEDFDYLIRGFRTYR